MASKDAHLLSSFVATLVFMIAFAVVNAAVDSVKPGALGASYIFGDSLVGAGNNNFLPTLSKANIKPNGIDFKQSGGQPTGRYTNGRTIGDIIGMILINSKLFIFSCINFYLSFVNTNKVLHLYI